MAEKLEALRSGVLAGGAATLAMSAVMFAAQSAGLMGGMPPEKITAKALDGLGVARDRRTQDALAAVAHVGFGASAGALFAEVISLAGWKRGAVPLGVVYATGIWALAYVVHVPAFGIMPPPDKDRPGRPHAMVVAHWIYGLTLGLLLRGAD